MALSVGDRLGPFEIVAPVGSGGMGEVWKARDTRLDRVVAIKTSRTEFSERFASEARAVAALNHPNICQLYDVGQLPDGGSYLVMEYVDGAPIAPVDSPRKLLDLATQIADGLAAAHAAGFTHRDLKPDNVLVTGPQTPHPGRVKILDFGLAKQTTSTGASDATQTVAALTDPGTVLGTVAYMSPEQARGEPVDARSDQFSFGLIAYELAAGRRAFARASAAETMTAIIREDAEPLPSSVPAPLRWVVERCLAKDPAERYDSTRDLYRELKLARERLSEASGAQAAAAPATAHRSRGRTWGAVVLAGLAIAAVSFGAARFLSRAPEPLSWRGVMLGGPDMAFDPRLSPDGHLLAFQAMVDGLTQVAVMTPESGNWSVLTHDREHGAVFSISWSRDGTRIYYDRYTDVARRIFSVPVLGGDERLVLEDALTPEPLPDGSLLIVRPIANGRLQLHRFWPGTGRLQALPLLGTGDYIKVRVLPDGTAAVARGEPLGQTPAPPGFYIIDLATGSTRRVDPQGAQFSEQSAVALSADGRSLIAPANAGALWSIVRIPLAGGGAATPLLTVTSQIWYLDVGPDGTLYAGLVDRPADVVRFAPDGTGIEQLASFPQIPDTTTLTVLPDGRAVVPVRASSRVRLMVVQPGKDPTPLVNTTEETAAPVAACGSREVALMIGPEPHETIAFAEPSSGRLVRTITPGKGVVNSMSCSPDGQTVYFSAKGVIWSTPASGLPAGGQLHQIRAGMNVVADPTGNRLIVQAAEGSQLRRYSVPLSGSPERQIPADPSVSFSTLPLSPDALNADGRLLTALQPRDSWFNPPAIVDTETGRVTRIPSDNLHDYQSVGWTPDGRVITLRYGVRATLWKFQPTSR
jgi:Tol biopolymer transport system component/tRNA A-37 threonylcarbamoyl transferase component Bud32